jgi:S-(hydroxymethyl)glutathione dehydrogenase/alcohol dehydrogenase
MIIDKIQLGEPGPSELVVRTTSGGICGTDLHIAHSLFPSGSTYRPRPRASGSIDHLGPGLPAIRPGIGSWSVTRSPGAGAGTSWPDE